MKLKQLEKFIGKSIKIIRQSEFSHRCQHISFLVHKNKVISVGINARKTDTWAFKNGYRWGNVHSELAALKHLSNTNLCKRSKLILVNVRILRLCGGERPIVTCAAPCQCCLELARNCGISAIFYTTWDGTFSSIN